MRNPGRCLEQDMVSARVEREAGGIRCAERREEEGEGISPHKYKRSSSSARMTCVLNKSKTLCWFCHCALWRCNCGLVIQALPRTILWHTIQCYRITPCRCTGAVEAWLKHQYCNATQSPGNPEPSWHAQSAAGTSTAAGIERMVLPFSSLAGWGMVAVAGLEVAHVLGLNLQPLLTVGGVGGLALGFGAQAVTSNAISGINLVRASLSISQGCEGRYQALPRAKQPCLAAAAQPYS